MNRSISEREINRIKQLASEGLKQKVIAERLNISQCTVSKYDPRKPGRGSRRHLKTIWPEYT